MLKEYLSKISFKTKPEKELDAIIERINNNMSNNYKDAAQSDFADFRTKLDEFVATKTLSEKKLNAYVNKYDEYAEKLKGFTHKDQKPYWQ